MDEKFSVITDRPIDRYDFISQDDNSDYICCFDLQLYSASDFFFLLGSQPDNLEENIAFGIHTSNIRAFIRDLDNLEDLEGSGYIFVEDELDSRTETLDKTCVVCEREIGKTPHLKFTYQKHWNVHESCIESLIESLENCLETVDGDILKEHM